MFRGHWGAALRLQQHDREISLHFFFFFFLWPLWILWCCLDSCSVFPVGTWRRIVATLIKKTVTNTLGQKHEGTPCLLSWTISCATLSVVWCFTAESATYRRSEGAPAPNIPSARPGWPEGTMWKSVIGIPPKRSATSWSCSLQW